MRAFIVGKYIDENEKGAVWDFIGIFASEERAILVCKGERNYFVGPVMMGEQLENARIPWPGAYYPSAIF